jgi:STE24 endopeptidase
MDRPAKGIASALVIAGVVSAVVAAAALASPTVPPPTPPQAAQASANFDPVAATEAYVAKVPPEQRARSDAYFEGGYWLQLWGFLLGVAISIALLATGWSAKMRDWAERVTAKKGLQTPLYWVQFLLVTTLVTFPFSVYTDFFREHKYGLATQTFGPWLGDYLKGVALSAVFGGLLLMAIYAVIRRAPRTWWLWGSLVMVVFLAIGIVIAPVFIEPLFNKYTKLDDPVVRDPILRLARANGIPAHDVLVVDASRQTTRVSANVSGFAGTERIALNDNLLKRCSLPEIEAVMGHEMGHYVLHHVYQGILEFGVLIVLGFLFLRWGFEWLLRRWGAVWRIPGIGDLAGLPVLALLLSTYFFVLTPVTNTLTRTQEAEADLFGLNAAREPDGEAEGDLKLGEYRKLKPGPVEEFIFFDHPSGYNRILMAMRWKAENLK